MSNILKSAGRLFNHAVHVCNPFAPSTMVTFGGIGMTDILSVETLPVNDAIALFESGEKSLPTLSELETTEGKYKIWDNTSCAFKGKFKLNGVSFTLSELVADGTIQPNAEILVVTTQNHDSQDIHLLVGDKDALVELIGDNKAKQEAYDARFPLYAQQRIFHVTAPDFEA